MRKIQLIICFIVLSASGLHAQVPEYSDTTIINGDTILGAPIQFKTYDERFMDFMFFDGSYNIVSFRINESGSCYQFMLSSLDSSTYCFKISDEAFGVLMGYIEDMKAELETQSNWPVKCNYCQTMQMIWYSGDIERSIIKRSVRIPQTFSTILDACYNLSGEKYNCKINLNYFHSLQGFEDNLRGPSSVKE